MAKYGISRKMLILTAGIVWIIAGINILIIGIKAWQTQHGTGWLHLCGSASVFLLFFLLIFRRLYKKHTKRISNKETDRNCPFSFFDAKGWIVMVFMILLGVSIRHFGLLSLSFISIFYTGLSVALILSGLLFIRFGIKYKSIN